LMKIVAWLSCARQRPGRDEQRRARRLPVARGSAPYHGARFRCCFQ
jgi:hypothetical protein